MEDSERPDPTPTPQPPGDQPPASPGEEAALDTIKDPAGVFGLLFGMAIIGCLLMGVLIPLVFWVLSGVLGVIVLGCAVFARPPLRLYCLLLGLAGLVPTTILVLVQSLPNMQK